MTAPKQYRHKYGAILNRIVDDWELEAYCFRKGRTVEQGGLGKFGHFKQMVKMVLPNLQWNDWLELQLQSLCSEEFAYKDGKTTIRSVNWTGSGAGGKTFAAGLYSLIWFAAAPWESAVTLVSSSKEMLRRRVFPVIQDLYSQVSRGKYEFGNLIPSRMVLQSEKGDDKHAIVGKAVKGGDLVEAVENIKGLHAPRILLVIDEAPGTPEAIFEAIPNVRKACQDLTILVIGNAISHMDCHGRCCEPAAGWSSINVSSEIWKTKGVRKWDLPPGVCLHFDGFKSPNVKAGKTIYPYIYTYEDYRNGQRNADMQQTIQLWSNDRGFWAPSGVLSTIFDETMIEKYDGRGRFIWQSMSFKIASLDPGFGGDKCPLRFGEYGDLPNARLGVQLNESINIQGDPESKDELDYQIAHRVMRECNKRAIPPERFAMDATGIGRGVYAILRHDWGDVLKVEFGGAPSDKPSSSADPRPANEVYDRRVTELWYSCREFLISEQLKGLVDDDIIQFCSREYTIKKPKYVLDTKEECKEKIGRSPDDADAICVLVELARTLGAVAGNYPKATDQWEKIARKFDDIYDEDISHNEPIEQLEFDE